MSTTNDLKTRVEPSNKSTQENNENEPLTVSESAHKRKSEVTTTNPYHLIKTLLRQSYHRYCGMVALSGKFHSSITKKWCYKKSQSSV